MTSPDSGRRLRRVEARNSTVDIERKPEWIKARFRSGPNHAEIRSRVRAGRLHTVCQEAACPNIGECWEDREATFLVGGSVCTRRCDFCQIGTGRPEPLDRDEPQRVADSISQMGLAYATITGVARDDLPDGGAWLYAETVRRIHQQVPGCGVEVLIPDFGGRDDQLGQVIESAPEVLAHNIETVPRLLRRVRPAFDFERSLGVLATASAADLITKSNLILGLGEQRDEIEATLKDLVTSGCQLLTITQYLRPSRNHHPVVRWIPPAEFTELGELAQSLGFLGVMSGPLVRSSYRAGSLYRQATVSSDPNSTPNPVQPPEPSSAS